jgi:hypothetical protein
MGADMTPEAAIYKFLSSFAVPAYASSSVPDQAAFPYLTYDLVIGEWNQGESNMTVNVWYRTDSEAEPNAKVREIGRAIGLGGVTLQCDGGMLWLKKGSPWAQSLSIEGEDEKVKRRLLNVSIETITFD